jgi:transposase
MAILEALAEGRDVLAELPKLLYVTVKHKKEAISAALEAGLREALRPLLAMHLGRLECLEEDIQKIEKLISVQLAPYQDRLDLLTTIPGVSIISACVIVAELGVDMSQWPTPQHLSAWGGVAPGCRESGGKSRRAKTRKGNPFVCTTMVECAGAAILKKNCHFAGKYKHLCARTGSKMKARMAIARKLLVIVYHVLSTLKPYGEPKAKEPSAKSKEKSIRRHFLELKKLGVDVQILGILA